VGLKRVHPVTLPTGGEAREANVDSFGIVVMSLSVIVAFAVMAVGAILAASVNRKWAENGPEVRAMCPECRTDAGELLSIVWVLTRDSWRRGEETVDRGGLP